MHFGKKLVITTLATGLALTPVTSVLPKSPLTNYMVQAEAAALSEQDYINQVQAAFETLTETEKGQIRTVRNYLTENADAAWWKATINDIEFNEKVDQLETDGVVTEAAVYQMITDFVAVFYGVDNLGTNVTEFKTNHSATFDALFGTEITVEKMLNFAYEVEKNASIALRDQLNAKLADPNYSLSINRLIDESIDLTFANGNFAEFQGKLSNLGLSVEDVKTIRLNFQNKLVEPTSEVKDLTIPARNAMIGAFARPNSFIGFNGNKVSSVYKDTTYDLNYFLSEELPLGVDKGNLETLLNSDFLGFLSFEVVGENPIATVSEREFTATFTGSVEVNAIITLNNNKLVVGRETVEVTAASSGGVIPGGGGGDVGGDEPVDDEQQPENPQIIDDSNIPVEAPGTVETSMDENGLTTATASIDEAAVLAEIQENEDPVDLQVVVEETASVMTVSLSADFVSKLVDLNTKNTITMVSTNGTITVPSADLGASITKLTAENANMNDAKILISFAKANQTEADTFAREALTQDMVQLTPTTVVTAEIVSGDAKYPVQNFNSYVKFTFTYDGNTPAKNIVGIQWNKANDTTAKSMVKAASINGEAVSIPTIIETVDGKTLITVKQRSLVPFMVVSNSKIFSDVSSTFWGKEDIELLATKMVVNGRTTDHFEPNGQLTRAEFATMLVRAMGLNKQADAGAEYTDITGSDWYVGYVGAASAAGIINGYNDGSFKPNNKVTREEAAAMVVRAIDFLGGEIDLTTEEAATELAKFNDNTAISDWAKGYVAENAKVGIIQGKGNNNFDPTADATRAESVAMVKRFMKLTNLISE